jgi:hypothetical protein
MQAGDGKDPSEASLGSCTHVYRTGAGGELEGPACVDFETDRLRNLYQIAHSEPTVEKWDNSTLGRPNDLKRKASYVRRSGQSPQAFPPPSFAWDTLVPCKRPLFSLRVVHLEQTHLDNMPQIFRLWSTGRSDKQSALGSSETNGPCPFIPQTSKALEESSAAPVRKRSCLLDL